MRRTVKPYRKEFCASSGKHRFRDHREAVEALHHASNARQYAAAVGAVSARREVRSYPCGGCQGWHLTSQGECRSA